MHHVGDGGRGLSNRPCGASGRHFRADGLRGLSREGGAHPTQNYLEVYFWIRRTSNPNHPCVSCAYMYIIYIYTSLSLPLSLSLSLSVYIYICAVQLSGMPRLGLPCWLPRPQEQTLPSQRHNHGRWRVWRADLRISELHLLLLVLLVELVRSTIITVDTIAKPSFSYGPCCNPYRGTFPPLDALATNHSFQLSMLSV